MSAFNTLLRRLEEASAEANKGMALGETHDSLNTVKWMLRDAIAAWNSRPSEDGPSEVVVAVEDDGSRWVEERHYLACLRSPAPEWRPPEGWVLVPIEPTLDMLNAGWREFSSQGHDAEDIEAGPGWAAMIAAAPAPPTASTQEGAE